jgi:hypothetical protein
LQALNMSFRVMSFSRSAVYEVAENVASAVRIVDTLGVRSGRSVFCGVTSL